MGAVNNQSWPVRTIKPVADEARMLSALTAIGATILLVSKELRQAQRTMARGALAFSATTFFLASRALKKDPAAEEAALNDKVEAKVTAKLAELAAELNEKAQKLETEKLETVMTKFQGEISGLGDDLEKLVVEKVAELSGETAELLAKDEELVGRVVKAVVATLEKDGVLKEKAEAGARDLGKIQTEAFEKVEEETAKAAENKKKQLVPLDKTVEDSKDSTEAKIIEKADDDLSTTEVVDRDMSTIEKVDDGLPTTEVVDE